VQTGVLTDGRSLLGITGDSIDVTALKLCEARDSLLVRCVNLSSTRQKATIATGDQVQAAHCLTLAEERLDP
jgi:alpha-mannosidase